MTQSDNIKEFLKYASPRLDYIEHCMEKQAISAGLLARAATKARQLAATGGRTSKGKLTRLMGADTRVTKYPDGSLAFMYKDPTSPHLYRVVGDSAEGFGQKFLLDTRSGTGHKLFDGYKNPHHSNLKGKVLPSQMSKSTDIVPVNPSAENELVKHQPTTKTHTTNPTSKSNKTTPETPAEGKGMLNGVKSWIAAHPYLTAGGATIAAGAGGTGLGYGLGHGAGQQEGAAVAQRYYEMMMALERARLRHYNDSFLTRLANLFGTGELSNMIG